MSEQSPPVHETEWALARANVYAFLADLFTRPPTKELLCQLVGGRDNDQHSQLTDIFGPCEGVTLIEQPLAQGITGSLIYTLKLEFDALFRVPGGRYTKPYESLSLVDHNGTGRIWGETTAAVKQCYTRAGIDAGANAGEIPDYIGLELAFMHHLCEREADARQRDDTDSVHEWMEMEQAFLQDHLTRWVDNLCTTLTRYTRSDFYRGLALIMPEFVHRDLTGLQGK